MANFFDLTSKVFQLEEAVAAAAALASLPFDLSETSGKRCVEVLLRASFGKLPRLVRFVEAAKEDQFCFAAYEEWFPILDFYDHTRNLEWFTPFLHAHVDDFARHGFRPSLNRRTLVLRKSFETFGGSLILHPMLPGKVEICTIAAGSTNLLNATDAHMFLEHLIPASEGRNYKPE